MYSSTSAVPEGRRTARFPTAVAHVTWLVTKRESRIEASREGSFYAVARRSTAVS